MSIQQCFFFIDSSDFLLQHDQMIKLYFIFYAYSFYCIILKNLFENDAGYFKINSTKVTILHILQNSIFCILIIIYRSWY